MRRGPARGGFVGKGSQVTPAVGLELNLVPQVVGELKGIVEKALIHGDQRRGKCGRITAGQRMLVVGRGENQHILEITLLDGTQELEALLQRLNALFGYAQG